VPSSAEQLQEDLVAHGYLADRGLATVLSIAIDLRKPLLLEGEAGVGKTELAKTVAELRGARLIRLQCYEGIDVAHALYDWNYARQMLHIRTLEANESAHAGQVDELFGPAFLVRRPLLEAIDHEDSEPPILLIDEIDRADDEFEAFLLELLSDFQVTIPELGTISAKQRPIVIMTSNRTRELHDALKRRCLYHWIDHPSPVREAAIVRARVEGAAEPLARQAANFVASLRDMGLSRAPGVAETIDWVESLAALDETVLTEESVDATLGAVLKEREDLDRVRRGDLAAMVAAATEEAE
jgi:MoxR-like ATPase